MTTDPDPWPHHVVECVPRTVDGAFPPPLAVRRARGHFQSVLEKPNQRLAHGAQAIIQLLTCEAEIAVAFRLVYEAIHAEQRTPCPSHSIARGHVRRELSVHQPLQQLTVAIAGIGMHDGSGRK